MASGKKSFVMYCEWQELFLKLDDAQAGRLIKHIFAYVNDENPEAPDIVTDIAFTQIKQQFKRDLKKYERICERNKVNGSKGGRPKETQITQSVNLVTQNNPNNPIKDKGRRIKEEGEVIKVKEKKTIEDRLADFKNEIRPYLNETFSDLIFTSQEANKFFAYWTEKGDKARKMRFEKEKTWELKKRIGRWMLNKAERQMEKQSKKSDDGRLTWAEMRNDILAQSEIIETPKKLNE